MEGDVCWAFGGREPGDVGDVVAVELGGGWVLICYVDEEGASACAQIGYFGLCGEVWLDDGGVQMVSDRSVA